MHLNPTFLFFFFNGKKHSLFLNLFSDLDFIQRQLSYSDTLGLSSVQPYSLAYGISEYKALHYAEAEQGSSVPQAMATHGAVATTQLPVVTASQQKWLLFLPPLKAVLGAVAPVTPPFTSTDAIMPLYRLPASWQMCLLCPWRDSPPWGCSFLLSYAVGRGECTPPPPNLGKSHSLSAGTWMKVKYQLMGQKKKLFWDEGWYTPCIAPYNKTLRLT